MSNFFSRLNYSFGNEDWRSEQEALKIKPKDRILCITASGDRPLNLLMNDCAEVVAIDANPIQNYLLNLKCVAMHELDYDNYIAFLGATPHFHRLNTLNKLLPFMGENAQNYWDHEKKMINKGILYQGLLEKRCENILAPIIQFLRRGKVKKLFEFTDIKDQCEFIQQSWNKLYWRKTFDFLFNSVFTRLLFQYVVEDPGIYENLNKSVGIGTYLYRRMNEGLMQNLARESLLFSLVFKGKVVDDAFPPYLREDGVKIIKRNTNRIKVENRDIISYLELTPSNSFDCFSLSDVASYLSQKDFLKMLREVQRVAKPEARFSIRQFLSNHHVPEEIQSIFSRDTALEKKLEKEDRCFVYRFMAGTIHKKEQ